MKVEEMPVGDRAWVYPDKFIRRGLFFYLSNKCDVFSNPLPYTVRITRRKKIISVPICDEDAIQDAVPVWEEEEKRSRLTKFFPVCFQYQFACEGKDCPCEVLKSVERS